MSAPKLTRNPNAGKRHAARLQQSQLERWTPVQTKFAAGKTKAAREAGRERQREAFITAAQSWYRFQNGELA